MSPWLASPSHRACAQQGDVDHLAPSDNSGVEGRLIDSGSVFR
jgi:hypothetical protein